MSRLVLPAAFVLLAALLAGPVPAAASPPAPAAALSSNVHLFYYPWYGSPAVSGGYRHWQQGGHTPPEGIGADLHPVLGAYDSGDPAGAVGGRPRGGAGGVGGGGDRVRRGGWGVLGGGSARGRARRGGAPRCRGRVAPG